MKTLSPYKLGNIELKNRLVMPPMCMYSATLGGMATDFHFTHYETRAIGGAGLIIVEATGVAPEGRISDHDLGIWSDDHIEGHAEIARRIKQHGACPAIQIAHAGRKSEAVDTMPVAPSPIPFSEKYRTPIELSLEGIDQVVKAFVDGARRAVEAGYEMIEIHGAHGYLNHEFLSPVTNLRTDEYGGSLKNRCRLLNRIIKEIKAVIPEQVALALRVSASDYAPEGIDGDEMVKIINEVKEGLDIVHVSSGGTLPVRMNVYPGYQVQFAEKIKKSCGIDTIAVGLINSLDMIEEVLQNNRADLVALGRLLLRNPYFPLQAYAEAGFEEAIPHQYKRGF